VHPNIERVTAALHAAGATGRPVVLDDAARTAAQAAAALGIEVGQIANSLVFDADGDAVLVLASGAHRVDTAKVAALLGVAAVKRPDADFVRSRTGFAIGGVPPIGHAVALRTLVDVSLAEHEAIWAAAGHPHAVFPTTYDELVRITGGSPADVIVSPV
jgi:prolyl-tRNA editing enzyme YbaK/EbsC (Cys-tRNA(Pro) deacylase)